MTKRALVLIDLQNDFMPTGALPVAEGDLVVPVANRVARKFELVLATQDWHPANHKSFASQHPGHKPGDVVDLDGIPQVLWPDHCVQQSHGADFHRDLDLDFIRSVVKKGTDPNIDSYSGFFDNRHLKSTGMSDYLKKLEVTDVYILGLATDYCAKYTALDGIHLGFETWLIEDGCRGVELAPGDVAKAIGEMRRAGVHVITSDDV